jgi:trk system potassium uptake protein TrkH
LPFNNLDDLWDNFVLVVFNIVSVITTTGYATTDYTLWGSLAVGVFFFLTYLGGCAGSTSGGAKTMRILIGYEVFKNQLYKLIYPNGVFTMSYQGQPIDVKTAQSAMTFGALYVAANIILMLGLLLTGLDFKTALSGAATAVANVGPGVGDIIGPSGNFSSLPDAAKWMLCVGMILGRLEIMTILVLFMPTYWKH